VRKFLLILLASLLFMTGCGESDYETDNKLMNDQAKELLVYIDNRDAEGLRGVFSQDVLDTVDLDDQIESFFEIYEGKISTSDVELGHSSDSTDDGKITERYLSAYIHIETETGNKYTIYFAGYQTIKRKPSMQGIYRISITTETNEEYLLGKHISMSDLA